MRIYLDNNSTTRVDPRVFTEAKPFLCEHWGNPASVNTMGREARAAIELSRQRVASLLRCRSEQVFFTAGGTEAINIALLGAARRRGKSAGKILTCATEHSAGLETCRQLEREGFAVEYLGVDTDGRLDLVALDRELRGDVALISLMHANNETGVLHPIEEISRRIHGRDIFFHTDAVQSIGKLPVDVQKLGVDALSLSAHKFYGFKGAGALFLSDPSRVSPVSYGGGQEQGVRSGTHNVAEIVALGKACELLPLKMRENPRITALRDAFELAVTTEFEHCGVNGKRSSRVPNTSSVSFYYTEADALLRSLDREGVAVSMGAACTAQSFAYSHVLRAMGNPLEMIQGTLRFSLAHDTTEGELEQVLEVLRRVVPQCRRTSPIYADLVRSRGTRKAHE